MRKFQLGVGALAIVGLVALGACDGGRAAGPPNTMPDPAAHSARYFPVQVGTSHDLARLTALQQADTGGLTGVRTCDGCHADRLAAPAAFPPPPAASFRQFTCTGCHVKIGAAAIFHDDVTAVATMPAHASVGGMTILAVYAGLTVLDQGQRTIVDTACRGCHPAGLGVDHAPIFPLPHQNAAGTVVAVCADCHVDPSSRKVLGCAACHPHSDPATATGHAAVPGFSATDSALCARCHGDSTIPAVATHGGFPIEGSARHQGLAGGACLQCHPATRPAPKAFAADFSITTCTTCHVPLTNANLALHDDGTALAAFHLARNVTDFTFTDAACLKCHPDGSSGAPSYHPQLFPIDPASKHAGIACGDCHAAGSRSDVVNMKCASCHADPGKSSKFPTQHSPIGRVLILGFMTTPPPPGCAPTTFTPTSQDCLSCHALSHVDRVSAHPGGESAFGTGAHQGAGCETCHVVTRKVLASPPPTPAPAGYTTIDFTQPARPSQQTRGCATCHSAGCGGGG